MKVRELYFSLKNKLTKDDEESSLRLLFEYYLKKNLSLALEDEVRNPKRIRDAFKKYQEGIPVEYITNEAYFLGNKFYVDERVLIPRMETEEVVSKAFALIKKHKLKSFVDLGMGSGIIAISLMLQYKDLVGYGVDISKEALEVAKINENAYDTAIKTYNCNMLKSLIEEGIKVDLIISNPPYISRSFKVDKRVEKEPEIALYGDENGTAFYKEIVNDAKCVLNENGYIVFEIGYDLKEPLEKIFNEAGYTSEFYKDINGNYRIAVVH